MFCRLIQAETACGASWVWRRPQDRTGDLLLALMSHHAPPLMAMLRVKPTAIRHALP